MPRYKRELEESEEKSTICVKVSPKTYKRLRMYQARMVLTCDGKRSFTMDEVISALLDLVETAFEEIEEEKKETEG